MDLNEAAEMALRIVREAKEMVYDTETSGLDWKVNSPVGYVIGAQTGERITERDVVYVPIRHAGGGNLIGGKPLVTAEDAIIPHDFEIALDKAFRERESSGLGRIVGHHIKFDAHFSLSAGVSVGRKLACTQGQEAILDEYLTSFSLSACAERHKVAAKKGDKLYAHLAGMFGGRADHKQMAHFWRLPGTDPLAHEYAVGDGVSTYQLYLAQNDEIDAQDLRFIADMENDLLWTLVRMERRGMKVDMGAAKKLREAAEDNIRKLLLQFPPGFNARSPKDLKSIMEDNGLTDWPTTDKGNPSFTEKWLKSHDIGRNVIAIRQSANLINSFVSPLMERHSFKGRVHATLNPLKIDDRGTISGRFSCTDPNLQQVPKRNKELAIPFRRVFVADDGYVFWERDASQCEPRLFAHYSQDEKLVAGYNQQPFVDAHSVVAQLLNVERDPTAKRMNMGIFTGMQAKSLAGHMGWPVNKAQAAMDEWFSFFPGVKNFQTMAKNRLMSRGYVKTILGRRCRLEHPRFAYRGTSKIIQGSNADIIKYKLLQADLMCEQAGDIVQVLMTVHDSFNGQYLDTPEAKKVFDEMMAEMTEVQNDPINLRVPFVFEGGEGANWSEATFG